MNNKINILLCEDDKTVESLVRKSLEVDSKVVIKEHFPNGIGVTDYILENEKEINVIVVDLVMPQKDGFSVLQELKDNNIKIPIIVTTGCNNSEVIREVTELGARFFLLKPFDPKELERRIIKCADEEGNNKVINLFDANLQCTVTNMLHQVGIPSHIKGFQYIRDSILCVYRDPSLIGGITKELYPTIAELHNTTVSRVERAIRHAIEVGCIRSDINLLHEIFGNSISYEKDKPTNS